MMCWTECLGGFVWASSSGTPALSLWIGGDNSSFGSAQAANLPLLPASWQGAKIVLSASMEGLPVLPASWQGAKIVLSASMEGLPVLPASWQGAKIVLSAYLGGFACPAGRAKR